MNHRECQRSGARRGLLFFLLAALTLCALTSCKDPEKAKAEHISRGEAYLKDKKYQEASLEFRNAVQLDDHSAPAHWGLGRAYEETGQLQQAMEEYQATIRYDQNNLDARVRLGNLYMFAFGQLKDPKWKDEAKKLADEVTAKDPNHIEGHILEGTIYFANGDKQKALEELNKAVALNPNRVESQLGLALYYQNTGDAAKAGEIYQRAISLDDNSSLAHMQYARFLVSQNQPDKAEPQFRRAVEVDPQNRDANRTLVAFYIQQKQLDRAEQAARALADLDRGKPEGTAIMADFYSQIGRTDDAMRLFQETVNKFPDYTQARYSLGNLLLTKGDAAGAGAQAKAVLDKSPNDKQARLLLARVKLSQGEAKAAVEDLKEVLKQEPRDQSGLYYMADADLRLNQIDQARVFAGDLEKFYPDYVPAKLLQVQINLAAGDWQTAQRQSSDLIDRISKTAPGGGVTPELLAEVKAKALTARATTYMQLKNYAAARTDFSAARDLLPNVPSSYTNLAAVSGVEGKKDEAIQLYERALQIDATSFDALNGIATLYDGQGEFDKAHARVDQAIAQKSGAAPLHFLKAQIYGAQGGVAERQGNEDLKKQLAQSAESELRKALEIDPNFVPAFNALAALYIRTNHGEDALKSLNEWAAKRPDDPSPYVLIGMVEDARNQYDDANKAYSKALTIKPDDTFSANNLAWNYAEHGKGNLDEAMRLAQGVVQKFPEEPGFADTLGWVYFKKGLNAAAVEQLQKAVTKAQAKNADSPVYRLHLGQALAAAGRKAEARQQLQQALGAGKDRGLTPEQADEARRALASIG
ncbi:MAG: tetratricopeptide repeat protein [Pyrinomonadaceae bacterium]